MSIRTNTFTKVMVLLVLLLIPVIALYALSNRVSVSVLKQEMMALKQKDLAYMAGELNTSIENLSTLAFLLSEDIHIQKLQHLNLIETPYGRYEEKSRILERLRLLNVAARWDTQYSVISPEFNEIVSTNPRTSFDLEELNRIVTPKWEYKEMRNGSVTEYRYVRHIVKPGNKINNLEGAGLIIEVSFPKELLIKDLDNFKVGGNGDPFIYQPGGNMITNKTADLALIEQLKLHMGDEGIERFDRSLLKLEGKQYLVNVINVSALDWYLVDYVPLEGILQPIIRSSYLFYGSIGMLLLLSLLASYLLYRNVQRPISLLIRSVHRLRIGDYGTRINFNPKNEFTYLFHSFNQMSSEIDQLIHKVYAEQIRSREANLKQLQSQINPHFLYNCFALIRSLTRLGKKEQVMDMAMHLSKYYRYTTRVEKMTATLQEELQLIESYLEIQKLHLLHLTYTLSFPESMLSLEVPRLLLQPLVENAVLHGIERSESDGHIMLIGTQNERYNQIIVEDNGLGMTEEQLEKLRRNIRQQPTMDTGCALWNIQQRLLLQFGQTSSLLFEHGEHSGIKVTIQWPKTQIRS